MTDENICEENNDAESEEQSAVVQLPPSVSPINAGQLFWRETLKSSKFILAPMVDQSELPFRLFVRKHKVECTYSPMFHAKLFVKDIKYRRDCLHVLPELDQPMIIQFCANSPKTFVEAAKLAAPYCQAIDLNLGCPQQIAKRGHYGAFLQDEWKLIHEIVKTAVEEVGKPITCKIRIFEDIDKTVKYAKMIESAGASLIGVHGRYREQKGPDTGLASWDHIKAVKEAVSIPVFANGNIQSLDDVQLCLATTSCEGVMSAEGLLHNPALFSGKPLTIWDAAIEYLALARQHPPPYFSYVRGHLFKILHHCLNLEEHLELRDVVSKTRLFEALEEVALKLKERYRADYEQFMAEHAADDPPPHPGTLPIFFCKPYYRPSPKSNSKATDKSESVDHEQKKEAAEEPDTTASTIGPKISKRHLKRMERMNPSKKLCIGSIVEDIPPRFVPKRPIGLCALCPNPRGLKCEYDCCRKCCRIKTHEDVLDCQAHHFLVKTRQLKASQPTAVTATTVAVGGDHDR